MSEQYQAIPDPRDFSRWIGYRRVSDGVVVGPDDPEFRSWARAGGVVEPPVPPPPPPETPSERLSKLKAPRVITGSRSTDKDAILTSVLRALSDAGVVIDQTRS